MPQMVVVRKDAGETKVYATLYDESESAAIIKRCVKAGGHGVRLVTPRQGQKAPDYPPDLL